MKSPAQKKLVLEHVRIERSEIEEAGEYDLEGLFIRLGYAIDSIGAKRVVLDTVEALFAGLTNHAILRAELRRLFHWLKQRGATAVITGERGISVLPITSLKLDHQASTQRVATGIAKLDAMLGGKGVFRGSSVLVSGSPGSGKSSIGATFIDAACDQILALPTLVRRLPEPIKKIIGDLSNEQRVLVGLDIQPLPPRKQMIPMVDGNKESVNLEAEN